MVGTVACNASHEALRLSGSGGLLAPSSTPGYVGKAGRQRAGRPEGGDAGARVTSRNADLRSKPVLGCVWYLVCALALAQVFGNNLNGTIDMQMRRIHISAAAVVTPGAQLASLQVALHVTKRHNGAKASNRVSVMVGTVACNASHEALRLSGSGGLLSRWSRVFDTSVCPQHAIT